MLHQMCQTSFLKLVSLILLWYSKTGEAHPSNITVEIAVSNLLERKDKIEEGNRILIQKFQSQLAQQLEVLHKTVSASVMHQEQQLKDMEDDMQSFVSTKAEVG